MAFKLVVLVAFVAAASASGITAPLAAPIAVARTVVAEPYDPNPQYSYGYEVQDPLTGDSHGQVETRSGDVVQGSYALLDSDGTRRVVDYTADPVNGFNAVVSKQPVAIPAIAKVAAPVAVPAPVLRAAPISHAPVAVPAPVLRAAPLAHAPVAVPAPVLRTAPLAHAPVAVPAPVLRAAPLGPAPVFRAAHIAHAPVAASPSLLRTASFAHVPLARTTIVQAAPPASAVISRAPVLRTAPLHASTTIVSNSPVPLIRSAPLANVW